MNYNIMEEEGISYKTIREKLTPRAIGILNKLYKLFNKYCIYT